MKDEDTIKKKIDHLQSIMEMINSPEYIVYLNLTKNTLEWVLD